MRPLLFPLLLLLVTSACTAPGPRPADTDPGSDRDADRAADRPLAFVDGRAVRMADVRAPLLEAAGGDVLNNLILDRGLSRRLASRGIEVTDADVAAERAWLLQSLDAEDEDRAVRLLRRLREQRGLGPRRYAALLERNAALRKLAREEGDVRIDNAEVRVAYEAAYGAKVRVRLALLPTLPAARELREAVREAERPVSQFIELAVGRSVDSSASRGGLLPPISPADTAYPPAFREALQRFDADAQPGTVSPVVVLDDGFAVLQFIERIEASEVAFDAVRASLRSALQRRGERREMDRIAQSILADADVTILNDALAESWRGGEAER
ncbi:MAG: peptidylprolyl isomerase [Phycisphaeraceae bacterium]